jgi:iron complex transport system ATP-binding protein
MRQAICIRDVNFSHARKDPFILSQMNLTIRESSVAAILGANGAGKTTLLHLMLGLLCADTGEISFFGQLNTRYDAPRIKQIIGMVSQNESIPFDLSVEAYVLLGRAPHLKLLEIPGSDDWAAASNALKAVGMDHMAKNGITRLSGGEKQLVHVARALAQNPEILLLDEPCSHLDLINSRQMLYLMKTISQARRTVVFTTHDPNAAAAIADQIILLKKGTIVAQGTPGETLTEKLLTQTYGGPVTVMKTIRGPRVLVI